VQPAASPARVVLVSGHMVDSPDRASPRFPPAQESYVTAEVERALDRWGVGAGATVICGGARGSDIIVAEAAVARGADVLLCLALPAAEFERESVALPGTDWSARFRRLLDVAEVRQLDGGAGAGDDPFARANEWMVDTATALAGGRPHVIVVWDGHSGDGPGGTEDLVRRLGDSAAGEATVVIDPTPGD
jgi:hypothetical protein